jgi:hypothetical protein
MYVLFLVQEWAKYELMMKNLFDMTIVCNLVTLLMTEPVSSLIRFMEKERSVHKILMWGRNYLQENKIIIIIYKKFTENSHSLQNMKTVH